MPAMFRSIPGLDSIAEKTNKVLVSLKKNIAMKKNCQNKSVL